MLGRKSYTPEEIAAARTAIATAVAAYRALAESVGTGPADDPVRGSFEALYFTNLVLVLDRYFVHRVRLVTGKDGNPLNEVELIADCLVGNNGNYRTGGVIKLIPGESIVKLRAGEPIRLTAEDFERLAAAFFAELERRFR